MNRISNYLVGLIFLSVVFFNSQKVYGEDVQIILEQLTNLQKDIKTLEKAVYSQDTKITSSDIEISNQSSDILTKHLLKLSELEEQFQILTNNFEIISLPIL